MKSRERERVDPVKSASPSEIPKGGKANFTGQGGAEQFNGVNPVEFAERSEATIPPGRVKSRFLKFTQTMGLAAIFAIAGFLLFQIHEALAAPNLDQTHYRYLLYFTPIGV